MAYSVLIECRIGSSRAIGGTKMVGGNAKEMRKGGDCGHLPILFCWRNDGSESRSSLTEPSSYAASAVIPIESTVE